MSAINQPPIDAEYWCYDAQGKQCFIKNNTDPHPLSLALMWLDWNNKWVVNAVDIRNKDLADTEIYMKITPIHTIEYRPFGDEMLVNFFNESGVTIASVQYPLTTRPDGGADQRIADYMALVLSNAAPF